MHLREVFATQFQGSDGPVRLRLNEGANPFQVTPAVATAFQRIIRSLLFPVETAAHELEEIALDGTFECGLILQVGKTPVRVRRGVDPSTCKLQLLDESRRFVTRLRGAESVAQGLRKNLDFPDHRLFRAINQLDSEALMTWTNQTDASQEWELPEDDEWDLDFDSPQAPVGDLDDLSVGISVPQKSEVEHAKRAFLQAVQAEALQDRATALEDELDELAAKVDSLKKDNPRLREVKDELSLLDALTQVSEEDWTTLDDPEGQLARLNRQFTLLDKRRQRLAKTPDSADPLHKNLLLIAGLIATVVCTIFALSGTRMRPLALGNVVSLALALAGLLQWFKQHEDIGARRRRELDIVDEQVAAESAFNQYNRRLSETRVRLGVQNAQELRQLTEKREALTAELKALREAQRDSFKRGTGNQLTALVAQKQAELNELNEAREALQAPPESA
ncbi:MAG: hypothetical protein KC561_17450, partial [Myxococcales bacterium]|nr:hypothetical protein [Myxococcales bacterium]